MIQILLIIALIANLIWLAWAINKIPSTEEGRSALRSEKAMQYLHRKEKLDKKVCIHKYKRKSILDVDGSIIRNVCRSAELLNVCRLFKNFLQADVKFRFGQKNQ